MGSRLHGEMGLKAHIMLKRYIRTAFPLPVEDSAAWGSPVQQGLTGCTFPASSRNHAHASY
jgi:hypothetical protein